MNLGATILKNRREELEAKAIGSSLADIRKVRKDQEFREAFTRHIRDLLEQIEEAILEGKEPPRKRIEHQFADYNFKVVDQGPEKGLKSDFDLSANPLHTIWDGFRVAYRAKGVELIINSQHDGVGMESWFELSVAPMMKATRDGMEFVGDKQA